MTMKKVTTGIFAVLLMALIAVGMTACGGDGASGDGGSAGGKFTPGTYTGEGKGMAGTIEVTITVDENNITDVEITDPGETAGIGGKEAIADDTFKNQILDAQSAEIDGVAGATITSTGVKNAVEDALSQATGE